MGLLVVLSASDLLLADGGEWGIGGTFWCCRCVFHDVCEWHLGRVSLLARATWLASGARMA